VENTYLEEATPHANSCELTATLRILYKWLPLVVFKRSVIEAILGKFKAAALESNILENFDSGII